MAVKQKIQSGTLNAKEAVSTHYSDYNRMVCKYFAATDQVKPQEIISWKAAENPNKLHESLLFEQGSISIKQGKHPNQFIIRHREFEALVVVADNPFQAHSSSGRLVQVVEPKENAGNLIWINRFDSMRSGVAGKAAVLYKGSYLPEQKLSPIDELIKKAAELKNLSFDWDEDGAVPIEETTIEYSCWFLKHYYNYIFRHFAVTIQLPEIDPCPDGSIDLAWHTPNAQLLINIRKEKEGTYSAFYYGDRHNNKMQVKGSTPLSEFSEHLAVWMKYLA